MSGKTHLTKEKPTQTLRRESAVKQVKEIGFEEWLRKLIDLATKEAHQ